MVDREDCWLWAGRQNDRGYGVYNIKIDNKWRERKAHTLVYESLVGEVPDGLVLDHLCRVPTCVNPEHLEPVTQSENIKRAGVHSSKTHCPSGHPYSGDNLIRKPASNGIYRVCRTCRNKHVNNFYHRSKLLLI